MKKIKALLQIWRLLKCVWFPFVVALGIGSSQYHDERHKQANLGDADIRLPFPAMDTATPKSG